MTTIPHEDLTDRERGLMEEAFHRGAAAGFDAAKIATDVDELRRRAEAVVEYYGEDRVRCTPDNAAWHALLFQLGRWFQARS